MLASNTRTNNLPLFSSFLGNPLQENFNFTLVQSPEIQKIINNFKSKSSVGSDNISMKLFKRISNTLVIPLTFIINQSLTTGIFPNDLKIAKILPLFKKGCDKTFDNYRPISLLPCLSKVIERVVYNQLYSFFESNKLFFFSQHGFRKLHSTESAVLQFIDRILNHLDNNRLPLAIFIDLSKAFDTIDHDILLHKLAFYGIRNTSLNWFRSYLSERSQFVIFNETSSSLLPNTVGVPQGSILGPLLFIIYMNDLCNVTNNFKPILYADDTTLESPLCSFNFLESANTNVSLEINNELARISNWLSVNKLSANPLKSKYMIFHFPQRNRNTLPELNITLNGLPVEQVSEFNFLGVIVDECLSWKPHVSKICNTISRSVGIIKRLNKILPIPTLVTLYNSLIMSHIRYGILAWGNNLDRLIKLQKRAVRSICNTKYNAHTSPLFKKLKLPKVRDVYELECLKFFFKYHNNLVPSYFSTMFNPIQPVDHPYDTRNRELVHLPYPNKLYCFKCIRYQIPRIISTFPNNVIEKIHTHSLKGFALYAKNHLITNYETVCNRINCYVCQTNTNNYDE